MHFANGMRKSLVVAIGLLVTLGVMPAYADDSKPGAGAGGGIDIERLAPPRDSGTSKSGAPFATPSRDESYYPGPAPGVRYDPVFIRPFWIAVERQDSSGRVGLSGWMVPNTPDGSRGAGEHEVAGWLSFGLTWTWGGSRAIR